ncbi:MAG: DUF4240 domain-containing protein [Hyphomicrobiaceae bacterium]|nr:DUF4240 domain-containing protein [Hyphomicrobiaceae bacterium]
MTSPAMNDERFWAIIDRTAVHADNPAAQIKSLEKALTALPLEHLPGFEQAFREAIDRAFTWDLWGACYVIHGEASEEAFEAFRVWLLSKGREAFETALNDPEWLARQDLEPGPDGILAFDEFGEVAAAVWRARGGTGAIGDHVDVPAGLDEPEGDPFEEDEDHLSARFPRLWKRYGESPLG